MQPPRSWSTGTGRQRLSCRPWRRPRLLLQRHRNSTRIKQLHVRTLPVLRQSGLVRAAAGFSISWSGCATANHRL